MNICWVTAREPVPRLRADRPGSVMVTAPATRRGVSMEDAVCRLLSSPFKAQETLVAPFICKEAAAGSSWMTTCPAPGAGPELELLTGLSLQLDSSLSSRPSSSCSSLTWAAENSALTPVASHCCTAHPAGSPESLSGRLAEGEGVTGISNQTCPSAFPGNRHSHSLA